MGEIYEQLFCLLIFTITGIVIGILFDLFRILRKSFKTADWITYIQDILFWILTGFIVLFSIFKFNNGEIRSYIFLGITLGILIYMLTISKLIIKYAVLIINWIKKIISYPLNIIVNILKKILINPIAIFVKKIKKVKINNTNKENMTKNNKKNQNKKGIL